MWEPAIPRWDWLVILASSRLPRWLASQRPVSSSTLVYLWCFHWVEETFYFCHCTCIFPLSFSLSFLASVFDKVFVASQRLCSIDVSLWSTLIHRPHSARLQSASDPLPPAVWPLQDPTEQLNLTTLFGFRLNKGWIISLCFMILAHCLTKLFVPTGSFGAFVLSWLAAWCCY